MKFKILVTRLVPNSCKEYLKNKGYNIIHTNNVSEANICKLITDIDAIMARELTVTKKILDSAKKLKIIARFGVGTDMIDVKYAEKKGVWVSNTPLANYRSVAEHTIALILSCSKNIVSSCNQVKNENWFYRNAIMGSEIKDKTLGLIGLGKIGFCTAKIANNLGMRVIGYDPYIMLYKIPDSIKTYITLKEILVQSDFLSLHCPVNNETKKMINKNTIALMKTDAFLINTARGALVDENALYEALKSGHLRGAGIDVMEYEPPLKNNPLMTLDNVIITPHSAAVTNEAMHNMGMHAAWCIDDVLKGKSPRWSVNYPFNDELTDL